MEKGKPLPYHLTPTELREEQDRALGAALREALATVPDGSELTILRHPLGQSVDIWPPDLDHDEPEAVGRLAALLSERAPEGNEMRAAVDRNAERIRQMGGEYGAPANE